MKTSFWKYNKKEHWIMGFIGTFWHVHFTAYVGPTSYFWFSKSLRPRKVWTIACIYLSKGVSQLRYNKYMLFYCLSFSLREKTRRPLSKTNSNGFIVFNWIYWEHVCVLTLNATPLRGNLANKLTILLQFDQLIFRNSTLAKKDRNKITVRRHWW